MSVVLDASALLAWLHQETGHEEVADWLPNSIVSCVNWAEVIQKSVAKSVDVTGIRQDVMALGLVLEPFTATQAELSGTLWQHTKKFGLSLGDRACLALASEKSLPVLTADRQWRKLKTDIEISNIR